MRSNPTSGPHPSLDPSLDCPASSVFAATARRNILVGRIEKPLRQLIAALDRIDQFIVKHLQVAIWGEWASGCYELVMKGGALDGWRTG